jgi:hypothetical protein
MSTKPLSHILAMLQGGAFNDKCGMLLAEIVKGVDETGRPGKLTVTIDVKKAGGAVSVLAKATDKTPEEQADADLYWPTVEGNLSLDNPAQRKLDLQPVAPQERELRTGG